jgi:MSHA biogenesis protein MshQ
VSAKVQSSSAAVGPSLGTFGAADVSTGVASGAAFTYGEVGYVRLGAWGLYDDGSFAAVDKAKGECFTDALLGTAAAPADPNIANAAGKLGCYFGNLASPYFGRFIPDHFALSGGAIVNRSATATCTGAAFTYMDEALTASFVLTAQNFQNATTANYTGSYARLNVATQLGTGAIDDPAAGTRRPLAACPAPAVPPVAPAAPCLTLAAPAGSFSNGVSTAISAPMTVARPSVPAAPYSAFKVGVMPIDADGVRINTYNLDTVNVVAGVNQRALVAASVVRHGRMQVDNAYGSELLNLNVKLAAQYWNGTGYAANPQDSCTPLSAASFTLTGYNGGITAVNMGAAHLLGGAPMAGGAGRVVLTKPTPAPPTKGRALLNSTNPYLPGSGRVTFGVYKAGPLIYLRETY